ncbi:hypothetical protein WJX74_008754 [Apatococcus lobatus]|uniref:Inositol-1-monophosphatase n=2 Tax=Apatococcus TaxID=904362 RepID=A0AAW1RI34_9CHLO
MFSAVPTSRQQLSSRGAAVQVNAKAGSVEYKDLMAIAEEACRRGEQVIREAADKPREITHKGAADLVTDTDQKSEKVVLGFVQEKFPDHGVLGEEGGIMGNAGSDYLWICDPIDGTTNFTHSYPPFAVSVGVLENGTPVAGAVVEFAGSQGNWHTRMYTAYKGGGCFLDGRKVSVSSEDSVQQSLLITGFDQVEHGEPWAKNMDLFKHFTDKSRGVRRSGAAAVDMAHVACGIADAYWEMRIKAWDVAAGTLLVTEAGGTITAMDGSEHSVFSRSHLASNGKLHKSMQPIMQEAIKELVDNGNDFGPWFIPDGLPFKVPGQK